MIKFVTLFAALSAAAIAQHHGGEYYYDHGPNYEFSYEVNDPYHHDIKGQAETKIGDLVKGHYHLKEKDGSTREVVYTADKHSGFQAVVTKNGHQVFPEIVTKAQYAIPLHPHYQQPHRHQFHQPVYHQPQYHEPILHYSY